MKKITIIVDKLKKITIVGDKLKKAFFYIYPNVLQSAILTVLYFLIMSHVEGMSMHPARAGAFFIGGLLGAFFYDNMGKIYNFVVSRFSRKTANKSS